MADILMAPPIAEEPALNDPGKVANEIAEFISTWEDGIRAFLDGYGEYADAFRMIPPQRKLGYQASNSYGPNQESFVNTRVAETVRATETLATSIYRMLTNNDPMFQTVSLDMGSPDLHLRNAEMALQWQLYRLQYKKKLLKVLRSGCLFGSMVVEEPLAQIIGGGSGTDFIHRPLIQFAFDPTVPDISWSDAHATIDYFTPAKLRRMAREKPDLWKGDVIERAISAAQDAKSMPQRVRERRERAGYADKGGQMLELVTYYGVPDGEDRADGKDWVIGVLNGEFTARAHGLNRRLGRPFRFSSYIDFELEPLGYGVGKLGRLAQKQLDGNRNRVHSLITFGLFNMWLVSNMAGIKQSAFQIKPNGIVFGDEIGEDALRALRPDLTAANYGIQLDKILKEEHQGATGATPSLQALVTGGSATESALAQNEALRRVSVYTEVIAEDLVREHLRYMHADNLDFLDKAIVVASPNSPQPRIINKNTITQNVDFFLKLTTDKDFRPNRLAQLTNWLAQLLSLRNNIPANVDPLPVIEEIARGYGIAPERVVQPMSLEEQLIAKMKAAQEMSMRGVPGGGAGYSGAPEPAGGQEAPPPPDFSGVEPMDTGQHVMRTPVGGVEVVQ